MKIPLTEKEISRELQRDRRIAQIKDLNETAAAHERKSQHRKKKNERNE